MLARLTSSCYGQRVGFVQDHRILQQDSLAIVQRSVSGIVLGNVERVDVSVTSVTLHEHWTLPGLAGQPYFVADQFLLRVNRYLSASTVSLSSSRGGSQVYIGPLPLTV